MAWVSPQRTFCKVNLQSFPQARHPLDYSLCLVSIESLTEIGKYWIHESNYPLNAELQNIQIGHGQTPFNLVIDECLLTSKENEICEVFINADGSKFDYSRLPGQVCQTVSDDDTEMRSDGTTPKRSKSDESPLQAPQVCKVKISFNSILDLNLNVFDISSQEKLSRARSYKEKGNNLFRSGHGQFAFEQFGRSLRYLICMGPDIDSELFEEYRMLKMQCYLNIAACQNQTNNYTAVIQNCTKALVLDPDNVKALYRRGQAYVKAKDYARAKEDLSKAFSLDPSNKAVDKLFQNVKDRIKAEEQKLASAMSKMFHQ